MKKHTKISVEVETKELVQDIAKAEGRSMGKQIHTWAKKDAKRLRIGTKMVTKTNIKTASTRPEVTTNEVN